MSDGASDDGASDDGPASRYRRPRLCPPRKGRLSVYGQRVKQEAIEVEFGVSLGDGCFARPPRFASHLTFRPKTRRRPASHAVGGNLAAEPVPHGAVLLRPDPEPRDGDAGVDHDDDHGWLRPAALRRLRHD